MRYIHTYTGPVPVAESKDIQLKHMQICAYKSEDERENHLKAIGKGTLLFTPTNPSNLIDRIILAAGYMYTAIYVDVPELAC